MAQRSTAPLFWGLLGGLRRHGEALEVRVSQGGGPELAAVLYPVTTAAAVVHIRPPLDGCSETGSVPPAALELPWWSRLDPEWACCVGAPERAAAAISAAAAPNSAAGAARAELGCAQTAGADGGSSGGSIDDGGGLPALLQAAAAVEEMGEDGAENISQEDLSHWRWCVDAGPSRRRPAVEVPEWEENEDDRALREACKAHTARLAAAAAAAEAAKLAARSAAAAAAGPEGALAALRDKYEAVVRAEPGATVSLSLSLPPHLSLSLTHTQCLACPHLSSPSLFVSSFAPCSFSFSFCLSLK